MQSLSQGLGCRQFIWNVFPLTIGEGVGRIRENMRKSRFKRVFSGSLYGQQGLDSAGPPEKY